MSVPGHHSVAILFSSVLSLRDRHETVSYARVLRCRELQQFTANEKEKKKTRQDALAPAEQTDSATEMGEICAVQPC